MPESFIQVPPNSTGAKNRTRQRTVGPNTIDEPYVIVQDERVISYRGRASTFRTPGRAGTVGQQLLSLHNATGSAVLVEVEAVAIDLYQTVIKALTVPPPIIRLNRTTIAPSGGTALTKSPMNTAQTSGAGVTVFGDASTDGTSSATALANPTTHSTITQEYAPRFISAAGYEMADRLEFLGTSAGDPVLRAGEGVMLRLDYNLATMNPVTDMWIATIRWSEYTLP